MKVLVVDDNEAQAMTLSWVIEAWGHQTHVCTQGRDALACVREFQPDVLLLDIAMPGISGLEICHQLKAVSPAEGLKIIAQTGYGDADHRKQIEDAGFDEMLLKPVDLERLQALLAAYEPQAETEIG